MFLYLNLLWFVLEVNLSSVEVLVASTEDYDSLVNMAAKATVVINCVGPVRVYFYGSLL